MKTLAYIAALIALGAVVSAQQAQFPPPGTVVWTSGGGGGGGSFSTICAGSATTQVLFNDAGSCAGDAGFVFAKATDTITLGTAGTSTGVFQFKGTTSGTVSLSVADAAGTWTMKLPTTAGTSGFALTTDGAGVTTWSSVGVPPFIDSTAIIKGSGDATKLLAIEVDGITTGTTRTWTVPNRSDTFAGLGAQTFTGIQTVTISGASFYIQPVGGGGAGEVDIGTSTADDIYFVRNSSTKFLITASSTGNFGAGIAFKIGTAAGAGASYLEGWEQSADPTAPSTDSGRLFFKDNGAGKTQACVRFPTGATQCFATEP